MSKKNIIYIFVMLIILVVLILIFVNFKSNEEKDEWSKSFGGSKNEEGYFVLSTDDGGCIVLGYKESNSQGNKDIWMLKLDEKGNKKWDETYGESGEDYAKAVIELEDGYVIAGNSNSTGLIDYDYDVLLIKTDLKGIKKWSYNIGSEGIDKVNSIIKNENDNFIITGSTTSYGFKDGDLWILEVDHTAKEIWNQTYGGKGFDEGRSIIEVSDGYIIAGLSKSYSNNADYSDAWLIKIDKSGNHIWNKSFGFEYGDHFNQIISTEDGFIMVGHTSKMLGDESKWNGFIVKTDEKGVESWIRIIEEDKDTGISSIEKTDNGYLLVGYIGVYGEDDLLIENIDILGNRIWMKTKGGKYSDAGVWTDKSINNKYYITGYKDEKGLGFTDLWILKIEDI